MAELDKLQEGVLEQWGEEELKLNIRKGSIDMVKIGAVSGTGNYYQIKSQPPQKTQPTQQNRLQNQQMQRDNAQNQPQIDTQVRRRMHVRANQEVQNQTIQKAGNTQDTVNTQTAGTSYLVGQYLNITV